VWIFVDLLKNDQIFPRSTFRTSLSACCVSLSSASYRFRCATWFIISLDLERHRLLSDSEYLEPRQEEAILNDCDELCKIIGSIVRRKNNLP